MQEGHIKFVNEMHKYGNTQELCYQHKLGYNDMIEIQLKIYHHCFWKTKTEALR